MGARFADGLFVGEHGSWNRSVPVGYRVIFVPFRGDRPAGPPIDFVTGFLGTDGKTRGRPVGVTVDPRGALIVPDELSNTIWRVTRIRQPMDGQAAKDSAPKRRAWAGRAQLGRVAWWDNGGTKELCAV